MAFMESRLNQDPTEYVGADGVKSVRGRSGQVFARGTAAVDPAFRAVVVLRMLEGIQTKETADLLDVAEGTVLSRLSRAMKKLGKILKKEGDLSRDDDIDTVMMKALAGELNSDEARQFARVLETDDEMRQMAATRKPTGGSAL